MPCTDTTLAVDLGGEDGIYDISGATGVFRTNFANNSFPQFRDASHLYTYDNFSSGAEFYRYIVGATGATLIDGTTLDGIGGFEGSFQVANGLVYGAGGGIINPNTTPPSQIANLPLLDFYASDSIGVGDGVVADPSLNKEFLMMENLAGTLAFGLARYDLTTYLPESILLMPQSISPGVSSGVTMLRWGQDGLALLASNPNYVTNQTVTTVILLQGPFVSPQELTSNSAASLASSSSPTLTHGSGNTLLTLIGSNFQPGIAVTWNGSYRTTAVVDSSHVTIDIPASDLANAGTASLAATNPGAKASNTLQITIN
jgi:hypothetical protein